MRRLLLVLVLFLSQKYVSGFVTNKAPSQQELLQRGWSTQRRLLCSSSPLDRSLQRARDSLWQQQQQQQQQSTADINKLLVQKGFAFDSLRTRFDGSWMRLTNGDNNNNNNMVEFLMAQQLTREEAEHEARRPYTQAFHRQAITNDGIVFTIDIDGGRRVTTYHLGDWVEQVDSTKVGALYAGQGIQELKRTTFWERNQHVTVTKKSDGTVQSTRRYLEYNHGSKQLVVEREYQRPEGTISCKEIFVPTETTKISTLDRVPGCMANVNVQTTLTKDHTIQVDGEADAMVSRGLLAILCQVLSGQSPEQVLQLPSETITDRLGLRNALSKGRNDGLASMVRVVQGQIQSLLTDEPSSALATAKINSNSGKPTVAMLLSGGVDSSVALNLLHSQGYSVTAFYLKIWLEDELAHLGQCPWEDDYDMCIQVCNQAGVPLESISLQQEYKETVISYTVAAAQRGRTPNPDIMCNSRVKFGCFYDAIEGRGFDYVASGHYAQLIADDNGAKQLLRAPDTVKDQSYFLCALKQEQLQRVLFPIGHLEKHEVRQLAQDYDLPNKNRPDSQGLCFLGKVKFDEFLAAYLGESPGDIIDARTGEKIGRHNGVWYHTVGQRKGIGKVLDPKATAKGPWYVVAKDPEQRIVYASNEYDEEVFAQARSDFFVEDIHWISGSSPVSLLDGPVRLDMKIRHGPRIVSGSLRLMEDGVANVKLDQKDGGLAPGQYVVFYEPGGIECHGGAVISERHWARFLFDKGELDLAVL